MRSLRIITMGIGVAALIAAGATGAEEKALGTRLVDQMNASITRALDTKKVENGLLFMPTNLTQGIDVSDDPILNTRTEAYGESYGRRTK
jgi:hypothetical protein